MTHPPPPATLRVRLAPGTRVLEGNALLVGGAPRRVIRLQPAASGVIARWRSGDTVGSQPPIRALARRLLDAGLLVPDPEPAPVTDLTVVVPTHGRAAQLDRCLHALRATAPDAAIVVVDDGSPDADTVARTASTHEATLVRHPTCRGAAAARNTGAAGAERPLLAFIDSDVVVQPGCLARLAGAFGDPATGAAAPRVHGLSCVDGAIASYEQRHSRLDMGPHACAVRLGSGVSYVPSATLAVRRDAFGNGFDEHLEVGEDVDLVWRLDESGWNVWYDPSVAVHHEHRITPRAFLKRRFDYAASIGPLATKHPTALPALWVDSAVTLVALAASGQRRAAMCGLSGLMVWRSIQLRQRTRRPLLLGAEFTARASLRATRSLARAVRCVWWPLLILTTLTTHRGRTLLALAWLEGFLEARPRRPSDAALTMVEDLITTVGTWTSCLRFRVAAPLLPRLARDGAVPGAQRASGLR